MDVFLSIMFYSILVLAGLSAASFVLVMFGKFMIDNTADESRHH